MARQIRGSMADVRTGYQPVTLTTPNGQEIRGVKKNEDLFSVQVMDTRERIQGYLREDMKSVSDEKKSVMPVFGADKLTDAQLDDLLAYLESLKGTDARTGREIWRYKRELPPTGGLTACCGLVNRGFGVLGDRLFMTTLDAHLLALDMKTGAVVWDATLEDFSKGYASTIAPLVVKDKVIVGVAGGEYGIRGFIDAYDAKTGKRAWRFYTIPGPGEPGHDTWAGDSWQRGGASVWATGAYDPDLNLVYYGIGNPGPDYHSESRKGDNLYSDSLVALDPDTGTLRWHYQFTPHDLHDWDATEVPVLADLTIAGQPRKVVMLANRNGFFYTPDRPNGKLIVGKPYVVTTWAKEIGADGRPVILPGYVPDEKGSLTCPDVTGATNFWPPSYDPSQHLFFVNAREACATYYASKQEYVPGERYTGGAGQRATGPAIPRLGGLRAIHPATGDRRRTFQ